LSSDDTTDPFIDPTCANNVVENNIKRAKSDKNLNLPLDLKLEFVK
jgi:hypothetical protein